MALRSRVIGAECTYHGGQDTMVPVGHGRHTADLVENCATILPEHGHISMITEIPRISTELATVQVVWPTLPPVAGRASIVPPASSRYRGFCRRLKR
jgi:hypothetical protein